MTPEKLFADLLAAAPSRPLVTYYDEASGERSELSVRSLANWVAKTHHLLGDELGLGVGDAALVALPAHWISVPVLLGCLSAGLELTSDAGRAAVGFVTPETAEHAASIPDVYAIAPQTAAAGFTRPDASSPPGAGDFVAAVRPQADAWGGVRFPAGPADPCLDGRSRAEVVAAAQERAAELGVAAGARVLTTRGWSGPADWLDTLLVPLAVAGSVVLVRNALDEDVVVRRMAQERADIRI